jgi:hypothetical protein
MAEFKEVVAELRAAVRLPRQTAGAPARRDKRCIAVLARGRGEIQIAALHRGAVKASNSENIGCCARRPKEGLLGNLKEEAWA